jgi:hypothetical protein
MLKIRIQSGLKIKVIISTTEMISTQPLMLMPKPLNMTESFAVVISIEPQLVLR